MEFRSPIGVPRTNFDVFVLFGLVSSVKQNLVRVVRLVEKPIFGLVGQVASILTAAKPYQSPTMSDAIAGC
jgi:hypothetical protein